MAKSPYRFSMQIKAPSDDPYEYDFWTAQISDSGIIYVTNHPRQQILQYDPEGKLVASMNSPGDNFLGLSIRSLPEGYYYATASQRVVKIDASGRVIQKWGTVDGPASRLRCGIPIDTDSSGSVYVVERDTWIIAKFNPQGDRIRNIGKHGDGAGELVKPIALFVDEPRKRIYCLDERGHKVVGFHLETGEVDIEWGGYGTGPGRFFRPRGLTVDAVGDVYVTGLMNSRVQKFTSNGELVTQWGSPGRKPGQFSEPVGICVDHMGAVYVVDQGNLRLQKFVTR